MRIILEVPSREQKKLKAALANRTHADVTVRIGRESFTGSLYVEGGLRAVSPPEEPLREDGALITG